MFVKFGTGVAMALALLVPHTEQDGTSIGVHGWLDGETANLAGLLNSITAGTVPEGNVNWPGVAGPAPEGSASNCVASGGAVFGDLMCYAYPETGERGTGEEVLPVSVTQSDLQSLPIQAGRLALQPSSGRALINTPVIAYSTATSQVLSTTIVGIPVQVWLQPVSYRWDFGGGIAPFTTADPGRPYPNQTVKATYTDVLKGQSVKVTIAWRGAFRVAGSGSWLSVPGTASTTVRSAVFDVYEAPARLTR